MPRQQTPVPPGTKPCHHARSDAVWQGHGKHFAKAESSRSPLSTSPRYVHRFMTRMEDVRGLGGGLTG